MEEGLRHGGLAAVVGEVACLSMTASRRLQLAAEDTGSIGIALRRWRGQTDAVDFGQPTADSRLRDGESLAECRWVDADARKALGEPAGFPLICRGELIFLLIDFEEGVVRPLYLVDAKQTPNSRHIV